MKIIDSHTHAWGPPTKQHPWVNDELVENYTGEFSCDVVYRYEDLIIDMDNHDIDEAIVVGYPVTDWTDNWYLKMAVRNSDRLHGIAMVDVFSDEASSRLASLMKIDDMIGFRLGAVCPYDEMWRKFDYTQSWLQDVVEKTRFWQTAVAHDATVQILLHTSQIDQLIDLVTAYPELTYIVDHWAHLNKTGSVEADLEPFEPIIDYDSILLKISEVAYISEQEYPYNDLFPYLEWLYSNLGRERIIWGSDYPNVTHVEYGEMNYTDAVGWINRIPFLSKTDKRYLMGRSASKRLNLN
jgi:predicted TIM-barrel fold metal-dependent hydrolase